MRHSRGPTDTFRISNADILARLQSPEDSFVEMKTFGDVKDLLKTCVAFANSCAVEGTPGILCYGTQDDGTIEDLRKGFASCEKCLRDELFAISVIGPLLSNNVFSFISSPAALFFLGVCKGKPEVNQNASA